MCLIAHNQTIAPITNIYPVSNNPQKTHKQIDR